MNKFSWTVCFVVLTIVLTSLTVFGQVRPRIPRPIPNQPAQTPSPAPGNNRETAKQSAPTSQASCSSCVDDGFTWFEAESTHEESMLLEKTN